MLEQIKQLKSQGLTPGQIATKLNAEGTRTARGKPWAEHSVSYQIGKLSKAKTARVAAANLPKAAPATAVAKRVPASKVAARKKVLPSAKLSKGLETVVEILQTTELGVLKRATIASELLASFLQA